MARLFQGRKDDMQRFILNELQKGNEQAFNYVFNEYYKSLCQFSYSFIKDQDNAESLVQEVFIKIWEKREGLAQIDNLLSYLMVMVRNISLDYLRKEKVNLKLYSKIKPEESVNTTEEELSINEFEEKILKSVRDLPEKCRIAFELSRFENLTNKEIAGNMDISVKGVEALIGRSLKLLRNDLVEFLPLIKDKKQKNSTVLLSLFLKRIGKLRISLV